METIHWQMNPHHNRDLQTPLVANCTEIEKIAHFHQTIPNYSFTPLLSLDSLAKHLGLANLLVKDESYRFGLNSFKVLGSSYAIAHCLSEDKTLGIDSFQQLKQKVRTRPTQTFATATDGNHGLGVAWAASQLHQKSVVFMPKGSSKYRLNRIKEFGAQAEILEMNYDDTVRYTHQLARKNDWILVQDTSWEDYKAIPSLIMQGYLTLLWECVAQYKTDEKANPTHVILQAGVGSFAGAMLAGLKQLMGTPITFIIVEPTRADCLFQSGLSADGSAKNASGDLSTIMAGLSCGEPNPMAWDILKSGVNSFVTCPDYVAAEGMRIFGNPMGKDPRIISGESGAVPLGLLVQICTNRRFTDLKAALKIDSASRFLLINTEGDTDPENYRAVCWKGKYPVPGA